MIRYGSVHEAAEQPRAEQPRAECSGPLLPRPRTSAEDVAAAHPSAA